MHLSSRLKGSSHKGFTIIELMIVLIVVAVLVALAYPSYIDYVRKSKRGEAQQRLMNWAVNQEIYRSNNPTYDDGTDIAVPTHDDYLFEVSDVTASTFTLTATAQDDQANDKDHGTDCSVLTLDESGTKSPIVCWGGKS